MKFERGYYDVFMRTCAKYPTNIAVRQYDYGDYKCYTYSELFGVCEYIAQNLQQLQCNRGLIGLVSDRNIVVPCVIAAAHKCCTSFMFLDPVQPVDSIANEMKFQMVINITREVKTSCEDCIIRKPDKSITVFGYVIRFCLYSPPHTLLYRQMLEHSFIAMTSGSSGEPKHIQVPIECIQPNIEDLTNLFSITAKDIIYFSTPMTFDPSMVEILLACVNGASLLIAPEKADILFPENSEHSITVWQTTPSKFFQYSNADIKNKILSSSSSLKILALGGEPLNGVRRLKELKDCDNKTKIFTLYGVTEMSCWACAAELNLAEGSNNMEIPLGHCLSETEVVVEPEPGAKDQNIGKIILVSKTRKCIVLKKGLGSEELTSVRFVDTGDLAEVKNGTIYYRGRKDDVVKRFGHKINLQTVEDTVMQCHRIKTCSCVWLPKPMLLVVYFSSETISSTVLSDFLKCKLDDKHWPDRIVRVDNMPTNKHGKISKQKLSKLYEKTPSIPQTVDNMKMIFMQEVKALFNSNFVYDDIKDKDFFSIGGTSFLAVLISNKISMTTHHYGKLILPYLMSSRYTIAEIMQLAEKDVCYDESKSKRRLKRNMSISESSVSEVSVVKKCPSTPSHDPIDLRVVWSYDTGKCVDGSPTLFQTTRNLFVVVGSHSGKVVVFDAITGAVQGVVEVNSRVEASVFCYHEEPSQVACGVVGAYDGTVVCFELASCAERWRVGLGAMVKSKATLCNGILYVAAYDGLIRCIDVMTGLITHTIFVADQAISADLVLAKSQYILTGTLSGVCAGVHTETGSVAWRGAVASPVFARPVLYDADKYVVFAEVSGEIHCRTVEKGIRIWKFQGAKGNIFSSIYVREVNKLKWQMIFGCHDNKVYSFNVRNFQPSLHWKAQLNAPVYSTPCALNEKLLLAASKNGKIHIIDAENGMVLAEYQLPNETFSSPAIFDNYIYIGCRDDNVYALKYNLSLCT